MEEDENEKTIIPLFENKKPKKSELIHDVLR